MRLVDADLMRAHIRPYSVVDEGWLVTGGTSIRLMHNLIDSAPTIDAVPVTRCKDCGLDFQWGYAQALEDINHPMRVVAKKMEPVGMPQMQKVFRRLRGLR